jgi:23S rRNA pseudouridine1911/1915/1917 synthase
MKFKIDEKNTNKRLDKFLTENLSDFSRSQVQKNIKDGFITVNGKEIAPHYFLKEGDEIFVTQAFRPEKIRAKALSYKIKVITETSQYLVINKPAGLLVHPVKFQMDREILPKEKLFDRVKPTQVSQEKTLVGWLIKKYPKIRNVWDRVKSSKGDHAARPGIVHRLDRDVSGLIVIAKTQKMFDNLKGQFQARTIKKEYTALVYGNLELDEGEISRSISRSKKTGLMVARGTNAEQGKNAITQFEVIKRYKNYTLLKVKLITGRTHQIRVHLHSIGHSVVGDSLYQTRDVKKAKNKVELDRIFLCATKLGFYDLNNNWQEFEIKLPEDLTKFLRGVR